MIGTYSTIPELRWAVIAQRSLDDARIDAGVKELTPQALQFRRRRHVRRADLRISLRRRNHAARFAASSNPRAPSAAPNFTSASQVRGAAEISELAETFNHMAGDIEQYVERLKQAAAENRELFLGSIRMLAAAIDEKDPYTRGHSGRVAKYSMIIGEYLGSTPKNSTACASPRCCTTSAKSAWTIASSKSPAITVKGHDFKQQAVGVVELRAIQPLFGQFLHIR